MKLSDVKKIEFWAREYRLPLFWLTDKNRALMEDNSLFLYKNSVMHFYLLNERYEKEISEGYQYFNKKSNFLKYKKICERMLKILESLALQYKNINTKQLSDKGLQKLFGDFLNVLNKYGNVYRKTEEAKLKKFEEIRSKKIEGKMRELGKLRLELRKAGEPIFYIFLGKILKEISRRNVVSVGDLFFYTRDELDNLFKGGKIGNKKLLDRKKGYALWIMSGRTAIHTDEQFKKIWKWVNERFVDRKSRITRGATANKGIAKGRVRLILHKARKITKQISRFKKGEILVTEMTRPDTITACRNAAAIITDEGGITCHAAIVSREFDIPCVVGTKIATQILKDGDLVEIDAYKGEVKILNRP